MQEETVTLSPELKKYLYDGVEQAIAQLKHFSERVVASGATPDSQLGSIALEYFQSSINKAIEELSLIGAPPPATHGQAEHLAHLLVHQAAQEPTKRRRKARTNGSSNGKMRSATRDEVLAFMRKHRGTLRLATFVKENAGVFSKQFLKAGVYAIAKGMEHSGLIEKVGPAHYRSTV